MYTAECCGEVMRYFDYTYAEMLYLARKWAGNGNRLTIYRDGGGGYFFGNFGRVVYDKVVKIKE